MLRAPSLSDSGGKRLQACSPFSKQAQLVKSTLLNLLGGQFRKFMEIFSLPLSCTFM